MFWAFSETLCFDLQGHRTFSMLIADFNGSEGRDVFQSHVCGFY